MWSLWEVIRDDQCDRHILSRSDTYFCEVILKKKCSKITLTTYQNQELGILKNWTPYLAIFVMELLKFFENVFNRMLILTDTILGILLFKQDSIYFPLVIIAPQNCVVRSAPPVTISFISWNSSLVVSTSENRFDILTRWSALWTSSV